MSWNKVADYLLVFFIAVASGRPQNEATQSTEEKPPPFLQFTNGGIRVNFGGYHAEAGLGGLLRGAGTGGGLHASVGTPWGAHAGAGLGGQVAGDDGAVGGGLYARAGLGQGRPEAAAGLGGRLDGRSMNPISGGMYAGATPGGGPGPGVFLGGGVGADGGVDGFASGSATKKTETNPRATASAGAGADAAASASAAASETKPKKSYTNIQIIPSREKNAQKKREKVVLEATASADASADEKTTSQDTEVRRAVPAAAEIDLVKSAYIGAVPVVGVVKSVDKEVAVPASAAAAPTQVQVNATTNAVTTLDNNPGVVITKSVYPPRWYFRKRFWNVPRKTVYVGPSATVDTQSSPSDVVGELFANAVGNDGGAIAASKTYTGSGAITASKTYTGSGAITASKTYTGSLFDDIFNIPISTLAAVNQLLKNNVG